MPCRGLVSFSVGKLFFGSLGPGFIYIHLICCGRNWSSWYVWSLMSWTLESPNQKEFWSALQRSVHIFTLFPAICLQRLTHASCVFSLLVVFSLGDERRVVVAGRRVVADTRPALTIVGAQLVKVLVQNDASLQSPVNLNDPQVYFVSWSVSMRLM